jgi:hypothetical protein
MTGASFAETEARCENHPAGGEMGRARSSAGAIGRRAGQRAEERSDSIVHREPLGRAV